MQHNTEKLQKLLEEVGKIKNNNKYKTEGYNVFSVLKPNENMTSAFIADLLNPLGTHKQGGKFLELFLDILIEYKIIDAKNKLAYQNAEVTTEAWITNESRLDILLQSSKGGIIYIENKIKNYDNDQPNQIEKYYFAGIDGKNAIEKQLFTLLYLTPNGRFSTSAGSLQAGEAYFCISYSKHIFEWIEKCYKAIEMHNVALYQTLFQFQNYLSQQAMNAKIQELLKGYLVESQLIADNLAEARVSFRNELIEKLKEVDKKLQSKYSTDTFSFNISDVNAEFIHINFSKYIPTVTNLWENIGIYFECDETQDNQILFSLGVVGWSVYFDTEKQDFPKPENFDKMQHNDYWLWWEEIRYQKLQDITSSANIERIAKAIEEYAPLCDDIDKNFRKP
ncbi:MAG: hypothetical protein EAZ95_10630 [Bacteroidetes bacterium]|nr:MAG: hypothetical protein EAZ95_10630 [Bacteroidota bacterium]